MRTSGIPLLRKITGNVPYVSMKKCGTEHFSAWSNRPVRSHGVRNWIMRVMTDWEKNWSRKFIFGNCCHLLCRTSVKAAGNQVEASGF